MKYVTTTQDIDHVRTNEDIDILLRQGYIAHDGQKMIALTYLHPLTYAAQNKVRLMINIRKALNSQTPEFRHEINKEEGL